MPDNKGFLGPPSVDTMDDMKAEMRQMQSNLDQLVKQDSEYTKQYVAFSKFRGAQLQEKDLSPAEQALSQMDDTIYTTTEPSPNDPNNHPAFAAERENKTGNQLSQLKQGLRSALGEEFLPSKGSSGFVSLERNTKRLKSIAAQAAEGDKSFGDIWLADVDNAKLSHAQWTKLGMQARMYELMINSHMRPDEAEKRVQEEFDHPIQKIQENPDLAKVWGMTPAQLVADVSKHMKIEKQFQKNTAMIGTVTAEERASGKEKLGIVEDVFVSSIPVVGTGLGLYMGVTGDDVVINAFTGEEDKLGTISRVLVTLPILSPLYKAGKSFSKMVYKALDKGIGPAAAKYVVQGGATRLHAAGKHIKDIGKPDFDMIRRGLDDGTIIPDASETTLAHIIRGITNPNSGTAKAILRRGDIADSPVTLLAKQAVDTGDELARREIVNMILRDAGPERAKAIADSLGVDSVGMETVLRDMRLTKDGSRDVSELEKIVGESRSKAAALQTKLDNMRRGREAAKARRAAETQQAAEAETKAAEIEQKASEAPSFEDSVSTDAKSAEAAQVGETIPVKEGGDAKVVATSEDTVTVIKSDGTIEDIAKSLPQERRDFILNRVRTLGSLKNVEIMYPNNDNVSRYAKELAQEVYGGGGTAAKVVADTPVAAVGRKLRLKKAKAQYNSLLDRMNSGDLSAIPEMEALAHKLEADSVANPLDKAAKSRVNFTAEVRKTIQTLNKNFKPAGQATVPKVETVVAKPAKSLAVSVENATDVRELDKLDVKSGKVWASWLESKAQTPEYRAFSKRILDHIPDDLEVRIVGKKGWDDGVKATTMVRLNNLRGALATNNTTGKQTLFLNGRTWATGTGSISPEQVVMHELIHSATSSKLNAVLNGKSINDSEIKAAKKIMDLMTDAQLHYVTVKGDLRADVVRVGDLAFSSVREFVAYGLSNPQMQAFLKGVELGEGKNVFTKFVEAVREMLNIPVGSNNALSRLIETTEELLVSAEKNTKTILRKGAGTPQP